MNGTRKQKMNKRVNKPKKYNCIVKVGNNPDGSAKCLKYRLNDLLKFTVFLDRTHSEWKWFNVYSAKSRLQLASYTKFKKPIKKDA